MVKVAALQQEHKDLRFAVVPDFLKLSEAEVLARQLARYRVTEQALEALAQEESDAKAAQLFLDFFGIDDVRTHDPYKLWGRATGKKRLVVPLGLTPAGAPMLLDLKEAAENGMGPHGSMTGFTGSGKSEHLRSLILALMLLHSPEELWFILGDFKGEAAFAGLERAPHVQGVVTNLQDKLHLLDRLKLALDGEMDRRQNVIKYYGYMNVRDYQAARAAKVPTKPTSPARADGVESMAEAPNLPPLMVIIDEFSELLKIRPDMAAVFDDMGRRGRSWWIHVLVASQRTESGKMSGLIAQMGYRIGMKVKSAGESRDALGSSIKAYTDLKSAPPGAAFLSYDDELERYQAFFVSAPPPARAAKRHRRENLSGNPVPVQVFGSSVAPLVAGEGEIEDDDEFEVDEIPETDNHTPEGTEKTLLDWLVDRFEARGRPVEHAMWQPPLEDRETVPFFDLVREHWGQDWREVGDYGDLVVPYAIDDNVFKASQKATTLDLRDADGNIGVAGTDKTGKSTFLRTLIMTMAVSHSPKRVQFYGLDLGGGQLAVLGGLPHVVAVAGRGNREKMERSISAVEELLADRIRTFELHGIDSIEDFRARKFSGDKSLGSAPDDGYGDVFLVIDNIKMLHTDFTDLHDRVAKITESSPLNYGIHLIVTNNNWTTIRPAIKDHLGSTVELRLKEHIESVMGDKQLAQLVPRQGGRGLLRGGRHSLVAYPAASKNDDVKSVVAAVASAWAAKGETGRKLQTLPLEVAYSDLVALPGRDGKRFLPLGIGELQDGRIGRVELDLEQSPHLYIPGANQCGRTATLLTLGHSIISTFDPDEARLVVFESSYGLLNGLPEDRVSVYGNGFKDVFTLSKGLAEWLEQNRRPPRGLTGKEVATWSFDGPPMFILIDDLHILNQPNQAGSAVAPLVEIVPKAKAMNVHIFATVTSDRWHTQSGMKIIAELGTAGSGVLIMDSGKDLKIDEVRGAARPAGRGELLVRKQSQLVQVALPPAEGEK